MNKSGPCSSGLNGLNSVVSIALRFKDVASKVIVNCLVGIFFCLAEYACHISCRIENNLLDES